jgi:hypothetical protein
MTGDPMMPAMPHPLVTQLRFTRDEFVRGLTGLTDAEARRRFQPINSISGMIGRLAWPEQRNWLTRAQGQILRADLNEHVANGKPASTPPLEDMWMAWRAVTRASEPWLDALTTERLQAPMAEGLSSVGTFLRRTTYHYWYHLGEALAVRP